MKRVDRSTPEPMSQEQPAHAEQSDMQSECLAAELVLLSHPAVMEACVIALEDDAGERQVKAVVALWPGLGVQGDELLAYCRSKHSGRQSPASVDFLAELPKNARGKPARRLLTEQYRQAYRSPR